MQETKAVAELDPATVLTYVQVEGPLTDAQLRAWLDDQERDLRALAARRARSAQLYDLSRADSLSASQRRFVAAWNVRNEALLRATTLAYVFVIESMLLRGAVTAIFWIKPPPVPHQTCASLEEALVWTFALCERGSLRLPRETRKQVAKALLEGPRTVRDYAVLTATAAASGR